MTYAGWIVICLMGIFLAVVVTALSKANARVKVLYADKSIMSDD
ncbi:hypothetical protein [Jannaschia donghaensis]|uniref:Uncharacterized protein n=1 Tax=Jannaschia donghaensis TaxID=420998 RepID=A0A0M6YMA7_9RHOB|nr:hypothetical protein [Jannaschia donghaensis]CTQ50176.1 hypothetical protein JDO7802_02194 [Jannaschia donghaensis]